MNCTTCQQNLNAWMDGQLDDDLVKEVSAHLDNCSDCKKVSTELIEGHHALTSLFQDDRASAECVAHQVIKQLPFQEVEANNKAMNLRSRTWLRLAIALSIGFALASLLDLVKWPLEPDDQRSVQLPVEKTPVAQLTLVTSPVDVCRESKDNWVTCSEKTELPDGSSVRTGKAQYCEMFMHDHATVRMANETQVELPAYGCVELKSGRLWCSSDSDEKPLDIETPNSRVEVLGTCDIRLEPEKTEILVLDGKASIRGADNTIRTVMAPRRVSLSSADLVEAQMDDPIVATRWIHEILSRKGEENQEFQARINQLLSAMGRAKIQHLYEDELRALGESAALPLCVYIIASPNGTEAVQREKAARILSDIAGVSTIPKLIALLDDENERVRVYAASALQRLSGRDFGARPEVWQTLSADQRQQIIKRWRSWHAIQKANRDTILDSEALPHRKTKI